MDYKQEGSSPSFQNSVWKTNVKVNNRLGIRAVAAEGARAPRPTKRKPFDAIVLPKFSGLQNSAIQASSTGVEFLEMLGVNFGQDHLTCELCAFKHRPLDKERHLEIQAVLKHRLPEIDVFAKPKSGDGTEGIHAKAQRRKGKRLYRHSPGG